MGHAWFLLVLLFSLATAADVALTNDIINIITKGDKELDSSVTWVSGSTNKIDIKLKRIQEYEGNNVVSDSELKFGDFSWKIENVVNGDASETSSLDIKGQATNTKGPTTSCSTSLEIPAKSEFAQFVTKTGTWSWTSKSDTAKLGITYQVNFNTVDLDKLPMDQDDRRIMYEGTYFEISATAVVGSGSSSAVISEVKSSELTVMIDHFTGSFEHSFQVGFAAAGALRLGWLAIVAGIAGMLL